MTQKPVDARVVRGLVWVPGCAGWALGTALQLRQPMLYGPTAYAALASAAAMVFALVWRRTDSRAWVRRATAVLAFAAMAFGSCGLRSVAFDRDALDPAIEGRDIVVTGMVVAMPQHSEAGVRLRLAVESAADAKGPVRVPPLIELGWYNGTLNSALPDGTPEAALQRSSADVTAGDRWRLQVRLKAPHGNRNPFGFDYELSLWERGVQATGYIRAGPRDTTPQRLGEGWSHPVERARQVVRDAIFARVADRALAGVIAALTVGDQNAIERADWDLFRATGVAHLMSISGLHVTMFAWLWTVTLKSFAKPAPGLSLLSLYGTTTYATSGASR